MPFLPRAKYLFLQLQNFVYIVQDVSEPQAVLWSLLAQATMMDSAQQQTFTCKQFTALDT
jgi:hypothetical protein